MSVERLLVRFEGVRSTGSGRWIARCPAHTDRSPSLSVRELDDGRVLVHDFGGCDVAAVLGALGLEFADLFPEQSPRHFQPERRPWSAAQMLALADRELRVSALILSDVVQRGSVSSEELQRLCQAGGRIGTLVDAI